MNPKPKFKYPFCPQCRGSIDVYEWLDTGHGLVAVCPDCYPKAPKPKIQTLAPGDSLPNGGVVLAYKPDPIDPVLLGTVLAFLPHNDFHHFATWTYNWSMSPQFRTGGGSYYETLAEAAAEFGLEAIQP